MNCKRGKREVVSINSQQYRQNYVESILGLVAAVLM